MRIPGLHGEDLIIGEGDTRIMGIVNVTPDSFSDGGQFYDAGRAVSHGLSLVAEGAHVLDVGGESTRPGHSPVDAREQIRRIAPVISGLRLQTSVPISVDTTSAEVASAALEAGADWINDTTALSADPHLAVTAAQFGCAVVLMHRFDPPRKPGDGATGRDVLVQIVDNLGDRVEHASRSGIDLDRIILDPGLGFGTLFEDSLAIMADIGPMRRLPHPLLVGPSRKSFIGQITDKPADQRLHGTSAAVAILAMQRVEIIRVHDVAAMVDVVKVADELREKTTEAEKGECPD